MEEDLQETGKDYPGMAETERDWKGTKKGLGGILLDWRKLAGTDRDWERLEWELKED